MTSIRVFVAVKIPNIGGVEKLYFYLRDKLEHHRIRWIAPETFHITLKFIGDIEESSVSLIVDELRQVGELTAPFVLHVEGCGVFARKQRGGVVWLGVNAPDSMIHLKGLIEHRLGDFVSSDQQVYRPHLTVGRIKGYKYSLQVGDLISQFKMEGSHKMQVNKFVLMRSQLSEKGAKYTVIEKFHLGK